MTNTYMEVAMKVSIRTKFVNLVKTSFEYLKEYYKDNPILFIAENYGVLATFTASGYMALFPHGEVLYPFFGWLTSDLTLTICCIIRKNLNMAFMTGGYTLLSVYGLINILVFGN